jgi:cytochrome c-type biogenesis protein CcmF
VMLSGLGPVIAWRRATATNARRSLRGPLAVAAATAVGLALVSGVATRPLALAMFGAGAFVVAVVAQEFWRGTRARRDNSGEAAPAALVALVRRNRRRYGGYLVHLGMAVIFVGVAASSAFESVHDVRLSPGQSARIDGYDVHYRRATSALSNEKVTLGATLDVSRKGHRVATLTPTRGYYASLEPGMGPVGRYFEGEATSEVGLRAGLRRDIWTAVQPDIGAMRSMIDGIDKRFPLATGRSEGLLLAALAARYEVAPPPASFRLIVSPLVEWIWLGGAIAGVGALIALWPAAARVRRRAAVLSRLRLGRQPSHA